MGFDQWSNFYASYTVLGSSIEVVASMNGGSANHTRFGVTPTNFSTAFTAGSDQERAEELPYTKANYLRMGATGIGQAQVKSYMSTAKLIGVVQPAVQIEDAYGALVSANPTNTWFWHVWNYVPTGENQGLSCNVKLTYFVVFETRNQLAVS